MASSPASSPSSLDISNSSVLSEVRGQVVDGADDFVELLLSLPSSCARLGSFQMSGFSRVALTSFSRSALRS
jgi:hypothetical protein